jgi:hypothetical protein
METDSLNFESTFQLPLSFIPGMNEMEIPRLKSFIKCLMAYICNYLNLTHHADWDWEYIHFHFRTG